VACSTVPSAGEASESLSADDGASDRRDEIGEALPKHVGVAVVIDVGRSADYEGHWRHRPDDRSWIRDVMDLEGCRLGSSASKLLVAGYGDFSADSAVP
jgi:hypothetical protein